MTRTKLIALRKSAGLSQVAMADALHKNVSTYRKLEKGQVSLTDEDYRALCKLLNCRPEAIVEDTSFLCVDRELMASANMSGNTLAEDEFLAALQQFRRAQESRFVALVKDLTQLLHGKQVTR